MIVQVPVLIPQNKLNEHASYDQYDVAMHCVWNIQQMSDLRTGTINTIRNSGISIRQESVCESANAIENCYQSRREPDKRTTGNRMTISQKERQNVDES